MDPRPPEYKAEVLTTQLQYSVSLHKQYSVEGDWQVVINQELVRIWKEVVMHVKSSYQYIQYIKPKYCSQTY
jgi:hypothetical protein